MSDHINKIYTGKVGKNRGEARIWLESNRLKDTAFTPSTPFTIETSKGKVVLRPATVAKNTVSQSRGRAIIDINNKQITKAFEGCLMVSIRIYTDKIVFMQLDEDKQQQRAKAKAENPITYGEFFAGGGTLHESFKQEGYESRFAIDIEDKYLETLEENNPKLLTINSPIQDINWKGLPEVDVLLAGIPCECFSTSGVSKKNSLCKASKEAGDTGSLGFYVLEAIRAIRPGVVVIEEVPNFKNSMMAEMIKNVLGNAGYHISDNVVQADNFGGLTKRSRYVMIASMKEGIDIPDAIPFTPKTVESILEIPLSDREWLTEENSKSIATFLRREKEHKAKGNNFSMADCLPSDMSGVATITKGYYKRRLTDPILKHPEKDAYSFFTPRELARINGLPDSFILPTAKTTAGEIIGQGVSVDAFKAIAKTIKCAHSGFTQEDIENKIHELSSLQEEQHSNMEDEKAEETDEAISCPSDNLFSYQATA